MREPFPSATVGRRAGLACAISTLLIVQSASTGLRAQQSRDSIPPLPRARANSRGRYFVIALPPDVADQTIHIESAATR
jgi:hypothetical protein